MSSKGLNKWIVSGNLGADAQVKTVTLRNGEQAQLAEVTLFVQKPRDYKDSFTVRLSIWERSAAWRKLSFLKKGALVICTGNLEPSPYLSNVDQQPRAGLNMTVLDVDLDIIPNSDTETDELISETSAQPELIAS
ncbi:MULTISPECIES: single-stranded DNA-binding protein [unclassified Leptolyngbya]|uniref:single-stranded DNA-binding protein n=1 Tax=unclassified Leptolyngbya TaxID=2650499 RepID=UPI00168938DF|nr:MULTISPECIES: single-stranded DNA-binding protein [unclassified Leptolyngbya]MBD1912044.1 single-stranded DNA-binding protein [Leptolyngbya sp. FACHB-8]MBD2155414.1 single-stranded DNA-binding protein [Leptolyngbya sp. FACHB-16]